MAMLGYLPGTVGFSGIRETVERQHREVRSDLHALRVQARSAMGRGARLGRPAPCILRGAVTTR